jgi:hypothetical protein
MPEFYSFDDVVVEAVDADVRIVLALCLYVSGMLRAPP